MKTKIFWSTAISCIFLLDYFLFSTGNPSLSYSVFAGWFEIGLIAVIAITVWCGYYALKTSNRKYFVFYILGIASFSATLLMMSSQAREFAATGIEAQLISFMQDPVNNNVDASAQTRKLMADISRHKYSAERESFIPTFRRMDYLLKVDTGEKYSLILTASWMGMPQVWLLPYEGHPSK